MAGTFRPPRPTSISLAYLFRAIKMLKEITIEKRSLYEIDISGHAYCHDDASGSI
jgi:hypothetical protein